MSPEGLKAVLSQLEIPPDPNVLVGSNTADDAGVYKVRDDLALVQTELREGIHIVHAELEASCNLDKAAPTEG